jgi:hypothetical protein
MRLSHSPCLSASLLLFFLTIQTQAHALQRRSHHHALSHSHASHARDLPDPQRPSADGNDTYLKWHYTGFQLYDTKALTELDLSDSCRAALQQTIHCHNHVHSWQRLGYRRSLFNQDFTDYVCDSQCGQSLQDYYNEVDSACAGSEIHGAVPTLRAGRLWSGFNETCLRSEDGKDYCNGK